MAGRPFLRQLVERPRPGRSTVEPRVGGRRRLRQTNPGRACRPDWAQPADRTTGGKRISRRARPRSRSHRGGGCRARRRWRRHSRVRVPLGSMCQIGRSSCPTAGSPAGGRGTRGSGERMCTVEAEESSQERGLGAGAARREGKASAVSTGGRRPKAVARAWRRLGLFLALVCGDHGLKCCVPLVSDLNSVEVRRCEASGPRAVAGERRCAYLGVPSL